MDTTDRDGWELATRASMFRGMEKRLPTTSMCRGVNVPDKNVIGSPGKTSARDDNLLYEGPGRVAFSFSNW